MPTTGPTTEVSLNAIVEIVKRRRWQIVVPAAALAFLAIVLALVWTPTFRARALVAADPMVPQDFMQAKREIRNVDPQEQGRSLLRRMREILFARVVLESLIHEHYLYPESDGHVGQRYLDAMKLRLKADVDPEGNLYVEFDGKTAQEAMNVTNRLAQMLVEQTSAVRDQQAGQASKVVDADLDSLRGKLSEQEQRINQYKVQAGLARPDQMEANLKLFEALQGQVEHSSSALADEDAKNTAIVQEVRDLERQGVAKSESTEIQELRLRVKQAQSRYTEHHPERIALERQLGDLESAQGSVGEASPLYLRYIALKAALLAGEQRSASYRGGLKSLQGQLASYQSRIEAAPQHERAMAGLNRDYETTRTQYQELLSKQQEAKLGYQLDRVSGSVIFRIVEPASLPVSPVSPHRARIVVLGLLAGLATGLGLAFLSEHTDSTVSSLEELQAFTSIPSLVVIPSMNTDRTFQKVGSKPGIGLLTNPRSILSEQYRILADRIRFQSNKTDSTVVVLTSSIGGEGKTTTAINLALALSRSMEGRVLLVDADLRKPRIAQYLDLVVSRGFGHLLQRPDEDVNRYAWRLKDLFVLPGAGSVPDPVGALSSDRTAALFKAMRREFQMIIVDAPPILPIADAPILARLADHVVLVVRAGLTPRPLIERAVESLDGVKLMGIALNDVDVLRSPYAAAYQYYEKCYLAQ
jgi:capsular exopolysaccharide synthesis family protein